MVTLFDHRYGTHGATWGISFLSRFSQQLIRAWPIFFASAWMTGIMRLSSARVSPIISTPLQADAVQLPVLPGSYFDCFISACALARSPDSFGVAYGSYSARPLL